MSPNTKLLSCNFPSLPLNTHRSTSKIFSPGLIKGYSKTPVSRTPSAPLFLISYHRYNSCIKTSTFLQKIHLQVCHSSLKTENQQDPLLEKEGSSDDNNHELISSGVESGSDSGSGGSGEERDWTSSILLFGLWAGLVYYVSFLAPNQTPSTDLYFLKKLLNLKGDDGFQMNEILVAEWYIMGLWPLIYSMLLLPTGRSSNSKVPIWPFLVLSCFGGAYALIPYFVIWKPPPPLVEESELGKWPLNFLESKLTAGVMMAAGLGLIVYAGLSSGDVWKEFYQYFRESRFIHVMTIDFSLLSTFAPFWVYNDMTARKWYEKGSWLLPLSLIPLLGPCLYLLLRPAVSATPASLSSSAMEKE